MPQVMRTIRLDLRDFTQVIVSLLKEEILRNLKYFQGNSLLHYKSVSSILENIYVVYLQPCKRIH